MIRVNGLEDSKITAYHVGFVLGPCINASGRLDTAARSLALLNAENQGEAAKLAGDLTALNQSRKSLTETNENGNIRNSVNFPVCDMGVCSQAGRIAVLHKNVPNIISGLTTVFGQSGINIDKMMNQSRGEYAYSIIDIDKAGAKDIADEIATKEGILKVRVIK